jgi:hypothetical protein
LGGQLLGSGSIPGIMVASWEDPALHGNVTHCAPGCS